MFVQSLQCQIEKTPKIERHKINSEATSAQNICLEETKNGARKESAHKQTQTASSPKQKPDPEYQQVFKVNQTVPKKRPVQKLEDLRKLSRV